MPTQNPLINGVVHDWSSVRISVRGKTILGVRTLTYSDKLESTKVYGTHPQPLGRTRGRYEAEGSLGLYLAEANELLTILGPGFSEVPFDIICSYSDGVSPVITDTLRGARLVGPATDYSEGGDPLGLEFDLDILAILWNGKASVKNSLY
jgi:hypothetical protein